LPSETMIWQPEFTDKTLSRKPGAVQSDGKKAINIHIRSNVKEMLDELRTVYGLRTGEFFEMLITEKYLEHKRRK
ncbi:hypothetical protein P4I52_22525, partial [Escherichia coli]